MYIEINLKTTIYLERNFTMKKLLILAALVLAVIVTAVACDSASTPADTDAPATTEAVTEAPAADTAADTQAPTADTQAVTEAPAADTEADTQAPAADTEADTQAPAADTTADTQAPAADTEADTQAPDADTAADNQAPAADTEAPEADTEAPANNTVQAGEYVVWRKVRTYAHFDLITSGDTKVEHQVGYCRKSSIYQPLVLDGWTTGADKTVTLSGWMGANGGQDGLVWCVTPIPDADTTLSWTPCTGAIYAPAEEAVGNDLTVGPAELFQVNLDNARFGNATIDLSAYAGQTVNISVAVKCANSDVVVVVLCFTNITVAA